MNYANKKIAAPAITAKKTAEIVASVNGLLNKSMIRMERNEVFLNPKIWKDQKYAENWMKCLYIYCVIKKLITKPKKLNFKNIDTDQIIGYAISEKAKVLIVLDDNKVKDAITIVKT